MSGGENEVFTRWAGHHARMTTAQQALGAINAIVGVAPEFLSALGTVAVLAVGGYRVMDGALTIGALVALQTLMASFTGPFTALVELNDKLQQAQGDLARISDLLNQPPPVTQAEAPAGQTGRLTGRLELRNVSFGYSRTDPPMIRDFSLVVEPGKRIALVGGSGSGKSTLGRMIARTSDPLVR